MPHIADAGRQHLTAFGGVCIEGTGGTLRQVFVVVRGGSLVRASRALHALEIGQVVVVFVIASFTQAVANGRGGSWGGGEIHAVCTRSLPKHVLILPRLTSRAGRVYVFHTCLDVPLLTQALISLSQTHGICGTL